MKRNKVESDISFLEEIIIEVDCHINKDKTIKYINLIKENASIKNLKMSICSDNAGEIKLKIISNLLAKNAFYQTNNLAIFDLYYSYIKVNNKTTETIRKVAQSNKFITHLLNFISKS